MHRKIEQKAATVENLTYPHFESVDRYYYYKPAGVYFSKYGRFLDFFEIFDFARLTAEISRLARENRPPEKTAPREQKSDSIGNLTVNFYKMDVHRPIYDRFPVLKCKVNTFQTHSKCSRMRKFIVKTEIELMITRILQFAPNFGFEALRYIIFTYIKSLVGFSSDRLRMSRPI